MSPVIKAASSMTTISPSTQYQPDAGGHQGTGGAMMMSAADRAGGVECSSQRVPIDGELVPCVFAGAQREHRCYPNSLQEKFSSGGAFIGECSAEAFAAAVAGVHLQLLAAIAEHQRPGRNSTQGIVDEANNTSLCRAMRVSSWRDHRGRKPSLMTQMRQSCLASQSQCRNTS